MEKQHAPADPDSFPLLLHYALVSLGVTLAVGLVVIYAVSVELRRDLDQKSREQAVRVVRHLQQDIASDVLVPLGGSVDFERPEHRERLDGVVRRVAQAFGIPEINIFDARGIVLYSTVPAHIGGRTSPDDALFRAALAGRVSSAAREPGASPDLEGEHESSDVALLETYVPVASLVDAEHAGPPAFVIESYQDIQEFQQQIAHSQWRVAYAVAISGTVLFLVLLGTVRRAARIIRAQTASLTDTNRRLVDLSNNLEREVAVRTQELLRRETLAGLGTMAAGLAHEVNNPLATICASAQALKAVDGDRARQLSYLQLIEDEAFRVKGITSSLLDFSRQTQMNGGEALDAHDIVQRAAKLIAVGDALRDIELDCSGLQGVVVHAEPTILRQLVFNVLRNSIDAIRERERTEAPGYRGRIIWRAERSGDRVEIVCKDNGIGFEPAMAKDLMSPFFTTKEPGRGTGLGLALCHSMMERMGGQISIRSDGVRQGAEVTLVMKVGESP